MVVKEIQYTAKAVGKVLVSAVGFALAFLNEVLPVTPPEYVDEVTVAIGVLTLIATYFAPYAPLGKERAAQARPAAKKTRRKRTTKVARAKVVSAEPSDVEDSPQPKQVLPPGVWGGPTVPEGTNPRAD